VPVSGAGREGLSARRAGWRWLASSATWLSALVIAGVAVGSVAGGHGRFALGVAAMLVVYAVLLGLIGWAAHRARSWADGLLIGSALLHIAVLVSLLGSGAPRWFWSILLIPGAVLVAAVMLSLGRRRAI